jgi:hypothetical protein
MQKTYLLFSLVMILTLGACVPAVRLGTPSQPTIELVPAAETQIPSVVSPKEANPTTSRKLYTNAAFGLNFQYPSNWFGPEEYISGQTLRVEVGSASVHPYGVTPEQPSDVKNSYNIVIQYEKNNQNLYWKDTYQSLLNLKDGESRSGLRSVITRVGQLDLGRFMGFEYIFTLPQPAQTEHVYGREVILFDEQTNDLLTIIGQPNNVEVSNGTDWRVAYRTIDEANLATFHIITESIKADAAR